MCAVVLKLNIGSEVNIPTFFWFAVSHMSCELIGNGVGFWRMMYVDLKMGFSVHKNALIEYRQSITRFLKEKV